MGFQLNVSNSLEELSGKLFDNFASANMPVFLPHYVITQTEGMNNWLKLKLAARQGIAANIRFLKPNDLIQRVHFLLGGKYSGTLSPENVSWILFRILEEKEFQDLFPAIAAYYIEMDESSAVKRMALAEKVADLFDQYQVYRTDLIEEWSKASTNAVTGNEWQQYLWTRTRALTGDKMIDKIMMSKSIVSTLKDPLPGEELKNKIPQVHIFGISITTPYHLRIFEALSDHIEVSFYLLNPSPEQFWQATINEKQASRLIGKGKASAGELLIGNNLLNSWGKIIKDTFSLLFENEAFLNVYDTVGVYEPDSDSLLHKIQQEIFYNAPTEERHELTETDLLDGSITINACYTIAREVETLYNFLVQLVDRKDEKLSPRDIVVMVSDINAYAPYIKAVFNNAPYYFNYSIADESYTNNDNIINALRSIMELTEENFKAEQVVQLLDSTFIRNRCGVSNLSLIRDLVDRANIRFGTRGSKADDTIYVSWKYGIERMIYGICMSGQEAFEANGETYYPVDVIEGADSAEVVRFAYFVELLMASLEERKQPRTISKWVEYLMKLVSDLVYTQGTAINEDYILLQQQLDDYNELNDIYGEPVSYEVFSHSFLQQLSGATRSSAFAGGGITFCSLIPMRSIPFRVVAMLGLNFDKFPRKETVYSFNLMEKERRKGDRNVKDNDKHLFLETILSAKQYLYISYLGQNVKDNSILPPSALVDELIDYIQGKCIDDIDARIMITRHPLHGFSRKYRSGNSRFYNYIIDKPGVEHDFMDENKDLLPPVAEEISLPSFINFFKNPFKSYYNEVLSIRYDEESVLLNETEIFSLDSLQQWNVKHELLHADERQLPALREKLVRTGSLPLKNMSDVQLRKVYSDIQPVKELFDAIVRDTTPAIAEIELVIGPSTIKGRLEGIYDRKLVVVCFSSGQWRYLLEAYIRLLIGRVTGTVDQVLFISSNSKTIHSSSPISKAEALVALEKLLDLYFQGHQRIMGFYPDLAISPSDIEEMGWESFKEAVKKKLDNSIVPCTDRYIMTEYHRGFFENESVLDDYKEIALNVLVPLIKVFPDLNQ